jgi:hypothetical protein
MEDTPNTGVPSMTVAAITTTAMGALAATAEAREAAAAGMASRTFITVQSPECDQPPGCEPVVRA